MEGDSGVKKSMVKAKVQDASTSHIGYSSYHEEHHGQALELVAPPPPSLADQLNLLATLVQ